MNTAKFSLSVLLGLSITFTSAMAFAASPTISQISLAKSTQANTTIVGAGFGDFGGQIISWDDFDHYTNGAKTTGLVPIAGVPWSNIYDYTGSGVAIDQTHSVSGNQAVKIDWAIDNSGGIRAFGWANKGPFTQLYITYWRWMQGNYDGTISGENTKQFYVYGNNAGMPQLISFMEAGSTDGRWGADGNFDVFSLIADYNTRLNISKQNWTWSQTINKFQRWEYFVKLNNPFTALNGILQMRLDGQLGVDNHNYPAANTSGQFTDFRLGHMANHFTDTAKAWFDDVYVASTQARVEVCNANVYENCTVKHIQYVDPTKWTDTQIQLNLRNMKAFKDATPYLYVVDKDGNVSNPIALPKPVIVGN